MKKSRQSKSKQHVPTQSLTPDTQDTLSIRTHTGPLPAPEVFQEYAAIRANLPAIIIDEWLKEMNFRRSVVKSQLRQNAAKIFIVGFFALAIIGLSAWLAYVGEYQLAGAVVVSPLLVRLVGGYLER